MQRVDYLIAIGVVAVITMLIIPIPFWVLDFAIALNIVISLVILLTVMYVPRSADFSIFPTLLLITTIFRLAINVSSVRLILLYGPEFYGEIILAFGNFVVQGNFLVGIIIFMIIIAVMFMVITKGAVRISEVAARFTLDALPGKQIAIDADFNAGIIDQKEAIRRRKEIRQEADFYGAMDGASKYVQGDVRVMLIIILINMIGGLIAGMTVFGMTLEEAFRTFTILTIGEGLVGQLPALMLATATGIIVTRAVSENSMGVDLASQILIKPEVLIIGGIFLIFMSPIPGFPWFILLSIGALLLVFGIFLYRYTKTKTEEQTEEPEPEDVDLSPETMVQMINVEPLELEIGFNLIPFVDKEQGGDLLERIRLIRKTTALELGLLVPRIRIRDNMKLRPSDYSVKIRGVEMGRGSLRVKKLLAIPSANASEGLEGEDTVEPAFGTKAKWINEENRERAENEGYSVVDPPTIITTHLTEVIRRNAADILGLQETKQLVESVKAEFPTVYDETTRTVKMLTIQKVFQSLLREQVSIRNLVTILETLVEFEQTTNVDLLTNYVRQKLAKQISMQFADEEGVLHVFTLDRELESVMYESLQETEQGYRSTLDPEITRQVIDKTGQAFAEKGTPIREMIVLCNTPVRTLYKHITLSTFPNLVVLAYQEVVPPVKVEYLGQISINETMDATGESGDRSPDEANVER